MTKIKKLRVEKRRGPRGGPRPGSGRPPKPDRDKFGQVTCVLRHDTIEKLRRSATHPGAKELNKYFGEYLQWHLDEYPPVPWERWQAFLGLRQPKPALTKRLTRTERAALKELKDALAQDALRRHRASFVRPLEARKNDQSRKTRAR